MRHTIILHGITQFQKRQQVVMAIIRWRTPKLLLLNHGDQTGFQLEDVCINGLVSNPRVILIEHRPQVVSKGSRFILRLLPFIPRLLPVRGLSNVSVSRVLRRRWFVGHCEHKRQVSVDLS